MTKKDYIAIAKVIKAEIDESKGDGTQLWARDAGTVYRVDSCQRIATELCKVFADDNPLFDTDRFLKACGL